MTNESTSYTTLYTFLTIHNTSLLLPLYPISKGKKLEEKNYPERNENFKNSLAHVLVGRQW